MMRDALLAYFGINVAYFLSCVLSHLSMSFDTKIICLSNILVCCLKVIGLNLFFLTTTGSTVNRYKISRSKTFF